MNNQSDPRHLSQKFEPWLFIATIIFILFGLFLLQGQMGMVTVSADAPEPTPDRLAEPPLSEDSSQYEEGQYLYWMHCMPCHGDFGQGLTDEFIELWPEDHQNCWGRGCHGGRAMDEGFPIPKSIPAVISDSGEVLAFSVPEELYEYLQTTHPPQYPGYLEEDEYWAMTAYVMVENNLLSSTKEIGPNARNTPMEMIIAGSAICVLIVIIGGFVVWVRRNRSEDIVEGDEVEG